MFRSVAVNRIGGELVSEYGLTQADVDARRKNKVSIVAAKPLQDLFE
jgi:hypothetical protein